MSRIDPAGLSGMVPGRLRLPLLLVAALIAGIALDRFLLTPAAPQPPAKPHAAAQTGMLVLSPERALAAGVRTVRVTAGDLAGQVIAQATVVAAPDGAAVIGARADGTVTAIRRRLGDAVRQGDILGTIQSREAARLAEENSAAQIRVAHARHEFERQERLYKQGATSHQNFDEAQVTLRVAEAEASRARAAAAASGLSGDGVSLNILSPVSGRITAAPAVLGAYVVAGAELFRVADPDRLEVQAAVPAADVPRIQVGNSADIELPGGTIAATVRAITPDVDVHSRAATVVLLPKDGARLQPGQLVSTRIRVAQGQGQEGAVLVPLEALQKIGGRDMVFVRTPDGFQARAVSLGVESGALAEVREGLKAGEEVATTGAFLLKSELQKQEGN